ncbi:MAG: hypothetical protein KAT65_02480 [Methanophagales archaeon]|nr:hypothetical protein [Methanophagales archaeon]
MSKSRYPLLNNEQWLRGKYWGEELNSNQVAEIVGCSDKSVLRALKRLNIPLHKDECKSKYWQLNDEQWLFQRYWVEGQYSNQIADIIGCDESSVCGALRKFQIQKRKKCLYPELQDKGWIKQKYWQEEKSMIDITKILNCSLGAVARAFRVQGIETRTISEARKGAIISEATKKKMRESHRQGSIYEELNDEDWLNQKYWEEGLNLAEIKEVVGCHSVSTIAGAFERLNVERRTLSEIGKKQIGDKNSFYGKHHSKETKEQLSDATRARWQDEKFLRRWFKSVQRHPNSIEGTISEILQKNFPNEYKYNGNFEEKVVIGGMIPDFVNVNGKKVVIEAFGDYWHDLKKNIKWKHTEFGRKAAYSQLGYKCIVIWKRI